MLKRHAENIARGKKETLIVSNKHKEYVNLGFYFSLKGQQFHVFVYRLECDYFKQKVLLVFCTIHYKYCVAMAPGYPTGSVEAT